MDVNGPFNDEIIVKILKIKIYLKNSYLVVYNWSKHMKKLINEKTYKNFLKTQIYIPNDMTTSNK